jgi:CubicO group peptidase (beta-lactamase class C family)
MKTQARILFLFVFIALSSAAQQKAISEQLDKFLSDKFPTSAPGASVLIIQDNKTLLRKGYGLADVQSNKPVTTETIFRIGSITKQFTSTAILKLSKEGKLNLDDNIAKFFPTYPTQGKTVTIQHLLTHTSGIKSYTSLPALMTTENKLKEVNVQGMIDAFKNEPFDFTPGEAYLYNNSGYFLLGAIIEKVSGKSWGEYLQENFFKALKMTSTFFYDPKEEMEAVGYAKNPDNSYTKSDYVHPSIPYSAGALFSTVDDLWKWDKAVFDGKVLKLDLLEKAWTPLTLNNGKKENYGYGWQLAKLQDDKVISHGGGIDGFVCYKLFVPAKKIFVVVLVNHTAVDPSALAFDLADIVTGAADKKYDAVTLSKEQVEEYVGVYDMNEKEQRFITIENDQLFSQRTGGAKFKIFPYAKDMFFFENSKSQLRFNRDGSGKIASVELIAREFIPQVAVKSNKPMLKQRTIVEVAPALLEQYVGQYELAPNVFITVTKNENQLMSQVTGQQGFEIYPETEIKFFYKVVDAQIEFQKSAEGKVVSLILFQGGRTVPGAKIK